VTSVSIRVVEVSLWCLVVGVLATEGETPSKRCQRFPSLLGGLDFQPGAIVKEEGQPMERRESSETCDKVVRKEERGWRGGTRGKVSQVTGAGGLWRGCGAGGGWGRSYPHLTGKRKMRTRSTL